MPFASLVRLLNSPRSQRCCTAWSFNQRGVQPIKILLNELNLFTFSSLYLLPSNSYEKFWGEGRGRERERLRGKISLVIAGRHDTSSLGASFERSRIKYGDLAWRQTRWQSFEIENPCSPRASPIHRGYQALGREIESSKYFYIYI